MKDNGVKTAKVADAHRVIENTMQDLKQRTIRGGLARLCAQAANFLLRGGSLMVLARLLNPKDFGLVGMITAFTGVLNLLRDFGLSADGPTLDCGSVKAGPKVAAILSVMESCRRSACG